jgi:hypothetical protein
MVAAAEAGVVDAFNFQPESQYRNTCRSESDDDSFHRLFHAEVG